MRRGYDENGNEKAVESKCLTASRLLEVWIGRRTIGNGAQRILFKCAGGYEHEDFETVKTASGHPLPAPNYTSSEVDKMPASSGGTSVASFNKISASSRTTGESDY